MLSVLLMKSTGPSKTFLILLGAVVIFFLYSTRSTYDYTLNCAKCLAQKHVVEKQLLGFPFTRKTSPLHEERNYQTIFGRPCEHVFREGGFGHSSAGNIACGMTAEGNFVRPRMEAIAAVFDLDEELGDHALARETFQFIDTVMPPGEPLKKPRPSPAAETGYSALYLLALSLPGAKSVPEWRTVLDAARAEVAKAPGGN